MFDIVGYAIIKKDAKSGQSAIDVKSFLGKTCRVYEFAADGGVLVLDSDAQGLAMFEKEDILAKFECTILGEVICPPKMHTVEQMAYATRCQLRKGGYGTIVRNMVIAASLHKGEFTDGFLWSKQ